MEPMYIESLRVENFRSIEQETFALSQLSILVGKNNTGKSNIMRALNLLLEGTNKDVSERDFFEPGRNIILEANIKNVEPFLSLSAEPHRTKIGQDIHDGALRLRRIIGSGPSVEKLQVYDHGKDDFGLKTGIEGALKQVLPEVIFIEAFQDPSDEAVGKSSATLGKLLQQIIRRIEEYFADDLEKAFAAANKLLNVIEDDGGSGKETDERSPDVRRIEDTIRRYVREVFHGTDVRILMDLPGLPDLIGSGRIELRDIGPWTPSRMTGQGVQRVMYLALLRTLADEIRSKGDAQIKRPFLLLVEEPEAFLHPSVQGVMRDTLAEISQSNQVVLATHSPNMVSTACLANVILVRKPDEGPDKGKTCVLRRTGEVPRGDTKRLAELLKYQRSSKFLFADTVAVVEGPSDVVIFEAIVETWVGVSLDSLSVAFIESGGKGASVEFSLYLSAIGLRSLCVFDLDYLWEGAGTLLMDDPAYSRWVSQFWQEAGKEGIVQTKDAKHHITDVEQAGKLIEKKMAGGRDETLAALSAQNVWVLPRGEIEHYVGLGKSSKGKYVEAAAEIRQGTRHIADPEDIRKIVIEGLRLSVKQDSPA